ncbi:MAG: bifunctional metallophosphatase/5'-nucleotidase [Lentisphaeria bacterium]|nr:bifunctional metallophosphatase/5'-nucleotidase [Lentisphaeria bacterium]
MRRSFPAKASKIAFSILFCLCSLVIADEMHVRILHTSDLHGNLTGEESEIGASILRLGTVIDSSRRECPPGSVLVIDTGDTFQGSLASLLSKGRAPLAALNAMGLDAWIPGNHDFDFGFQCFLDNAEFLRAKIICGNLRAKDAKATPFPAWKLFDCNGAKIAIIGGTASYLPYWFLGFNDVFEIESVRSMLKRVLPEVLACKPDAVVLASHQGWLEKDERGVNEISQICREFPEIDLILGAHTHRPFAGRRIGARTWYVQPAAHGDFVSRVDLTIDTKRHAVTEISSRLLRVTQECAESQQLRQSIENWLTQAAEEASKPLSAPLPDEISSSGRPGIACQQSELICQAIAEASNAEIAFHGILAKVNLAKGEVITMGRLYEVIPYENNIVTCELTKEEIEAVIAEQWTLRKVYTFCGLWGATASVDSTAATLLSIGTDKTPIVQGKRYLVALNSFTAAGGGRTPVLSEILSRPTSKTRNIGISTRDALADWFRKHPCEKVAARKWLIAK